MGSSHAAGIPTTTGATETPALTPASSLLSYTSGHSPSSVHSTHNISPIQRSAASSMYPTLPGVNAMAEGANGFSAGGAPPTGLGSRFDPQVPRLTDQASMLTRYRRHGLRMYERLSCSEVLSRRSSSAATSCSLMTRK